MNKQIKISRLKSEYAFKLILCTIIVSFLNLLCFEFANAQNYMDITILNELKENNILIGSEEGINLESKVTRNEMIVLLIRMLGVEEKINDYKEERIPFKDTKPWAVNYIKYAYVNGLTKGITKDEFGGDRYVSLKEAETFLLRSLSYKSESDFEYTNVRKFAIQNGIEKNINNVYDNKLINRKELNRLVFNTLNTIIKNRKITLAEKLNLRLSKIDDLNNDSLKNEIIENNKDDYKEDVKEEIKENTKNEEIKENQRIIGYLPVWSGNYYKKVDYSKLTHLNIAFANPNEKGDISSNLDYALKEITKYAHASKTKVLVSLGGAGYGDVYVKLTSDKEEIKKFVKKIVDYVEKYNLDGVDLDIEGDVNKKFWNNYELFVKVLSEECVQKRLLLTTAVGKWYANKISDKTFEYFDYVSVMAYDNDLDENNHSTYDFANECIRYFMSRNIDEEKLVLGVPFYGYNYKSNGRMDWNNAKTYAQIISNNDKAIKMDKFNGYGYNGVETIKRKTNLAKKYGGVMIWAINQDASGRNSLLNVIYTEMYSN